MATTAELTAAMDGDADKKAEGDDEKAGEALRKKRLRAKNLALLFVLLAFVILVYFVSIVRMGGG